MKGKLRVITPLLTFMLLSTGLRALPEIMRIGLFYGEEVKELELEVKEGRYRLYVDGKAVQVLSGKDGISLQHRAEGKIGMEPSQGTGLVGKKIRLERMTQEGSFELQKNHPYPVERTYPGELSILGKKERLQAVNRVRMEDYLAGVVLAEAGQGHHPEFYKVQAVICRTYALHNLDKFSDKGFHLCDKVACQVYEGLNDVEPRIDSAVEATEGIVIVDDEIELITAAYHSNSGGHTAPSELPWSKALPYLRPVDDPFSKGGRHYEWEKVLPKKEWFAYLEREFGYPIEDPWHREYATSYCPEDRKLHFLADSIPLQKIRRDLNLNSTFFEIRSEADTVIFKGKGFGHGVGLSQEGAMRMAELGIPYEEIVHFYYKGVHLVKIEALDFFREGD